MTEYLARRVTGLDVLPAAAQQQELTRAVAGQQAEGVPGMSAFEERPPVPLLHAMRAIRPLFVRGA